MGCFWWQSWAICCSSVVGSSKIKVMKVDGHCLRFEAPTYVKEVLVDYPHHAVFHSDTVRKFGSRARPLHGTLSLQPGHLYFLVPLPRRKDNIVRSSSVAEESRQIANHPHSDGGVVAAAAQKLISGPLARRVSFASSPSYIDNPHDQLDLQKSMHSKNRAHKNIIAHKSLVKNSAGGHSNGQKPSLEVLPSSSDGVVRLKVVVSKRRLAAILTQGGDTVSMVESLVTPLLKEAEQPPSSSDNSSSPRDISRDNSFSWRPALESIPESPCRQFFMPDPV